tara:strand:- start:27597 stop:28202 length:606 start_codon:yes stop_codon:yes gene_type:complete
LKTVHLILWGAIAAGLVLFLWLNIFQDASHLIEDNSSQNTAVAFTPTFSLTDQSGNAVTEQTYRGKWLLVFFGFTNCPDICPTTLADLASVMEQLGADAKAIKPLFISVDPDRDQLETMAEYVSAFHPAIVGLTGTGPQIAETAGSFKAYFEKQPHESAPDGYTMGHTSAVYLVSPDGAFVRTYSYGTPPEEIVTDLRQKL